MGVQPQYQRSSPQTRRSYLTVEQLLGYLEARGMPTTVAAVRREHVESFLVNLGETRSPATVATRHQALRQFPAVLVDSTAQTYQLP